MSRYRNMGRAHLLSTADLVNPSACPGSRVDGFRCALPILRLGLWIRGKKNAGAFAPASSCIFRWNAGSERVAHAQVGATRFHPVGRLAAGIATVACDQVLLGNRVLLVAAVEQVEHELALADWLFPRVLGADADGVLVRPGLPAHRTRPNTG